MVNIEDQPKIVKVAYWEGITDIGQLTKENKTLLNKAVKDKILMKIKDYYYPIPKIRYTMNWNDLIEMFRTDPLYVKD